MSVGCRVSRRFTLRLLAPRTRPAHARSACFAVSAGSCLLRQLAMPLPHSWASWKAVDERHRRRWQEEGHNVTSGGHRAICRRSAFGLSAAAQFATQFPPRLILTIRSAELSDGLPRPETSITFYVCRSRASSSPRPGSAPSSREDPLRFGCNPSVFATPAPAEVGGRAMTLRQPGRLRMRQHRSCSLSGERCPGNRVSTARQRRSTRAERGRSRDDRRWRALAQDDERAKARAGGQRSPGVQPHCLQDRRQNPGHATRPPLLQPRLSQSRS
ncbi:hypothetical protein ShzoTeo12_53570 (plasmid) [Shinella zoogloeoides]|nr:hypothetical protein ShzoTeo12_53570 [Shinella zoogloeoides]